MANYSSTIHGWFEGNVVIDPKAWILPLIAFAGLLAINVVISVVLWWNERTPLHRLLASFWGWAAFAVLAQGLLPEAPETILAFGIPSYALALCLADFLHRALSLRYHARLYRIAAAAGAAASVAAWFAHAPFWIVALPSAVAVSVPLADVARQALMRREKLSVSARLMIGTVVLMALHQLDYPFLRPDPRFIPYAFAIACVIVFAQSICAPLVLLERTAAEVKRLQAEAIERERFSALGEASAVVAHEVRNPLATMTNTIELLRREPLSEEGRELLTIQRAEIMRLDRLVRDLLSFSKPLEPKVGDVEMAALVRDAVRSLRADAENARVMLSVEASGEQMVRGDPDTLHVALVNVLQNAIQASPNGGTVRVTMANGGSDVRVFVEDEGDGVPTHAIERMFEPFFTTRATGSGLGLAILDRIMKAHGGRVQVTNLPAKGARFELVFVK